MKTKILQVNSDLPLGKFTGKDLQHWEVLPGDHVPLLEEAALKLRHEAIPVAFPTETVYGLGADATRTDPVKGIYTAKGRPSDNPLIVHVCDLSMLRSMLSSPTQITATKSITPSSNGEPGRATEGKDLIPDIYKPLISRFWPGPLTILLPKPTPQDSCARHLAPEVTAGLKTFGARIPNQALALSLIKLADTPLAAPSANASTKPSPTTAQHVKDDLDGRIELILDGGSCQVGVESTVVDGLCNPPVILRPGGVSMDELRECAGWETVEVAYKDQSEVGKSAPRAPGMKYKHYSPKARVILYEHTAHMPGGPPLHEVQDDGPLQNGATNGATNETTNGDSHRQMSIGVVRTRRWQRQGVFESHLANSYHVNGATNGDLEHRVVRGKLPSTSFQVLDLDLGQDIRSIAHGLFSALRELDRQGASVIFVEGIEDKEDIAAAVMNRLRKAASEIKS